MHKRKQLNLEELEQIKGGADFFDYENSDEFKDYPDQLYASEEEDHAFPIDRLHKWKD